MKVPLWLLLRRLPSVTLPSYHSSLLSLPRLPHPPQKGKLACPWTACFYSRTRLLILCRSSGFATPDREGACFSLARLLLFYSWSRPQKRGDPVEVLYPNRGGPRPKPRGPWGEQGKRAELARTLERHADADCGMTREEERGTHA